MLASLAVLWTFANLTQDWRSLMSRRYLLGFLVVTLAAYPAYPLWTAAASLPHPREAGLLMTLTRLFLLTAIVASKILVWVYAYRLLSALRERQQQSDQGQ